MCVCLCTAESDVTSRRLPRRKTSTHVNVSRHRRRTILRTVSIHLCFLFLHSPRRRVLVVQYFPVSSNYVFNVIENTSWSKKFTGHGSAKSDKRNKNINLKNLYTLVYSTTFVFVTKNIYVSFFPLSATLTSLSIKVFLGNIVLLLHQMYLMKLLLTLRIRGCVRAKTVLFKINLFLLLAVRIILLNEINTDSDHHHQ